MIILLALIVLSWPHFLFLFVFTLNFNKYGCNGWEEEEPCVFLGLYMFFVHACEACCEYSNVAFAMRVGEGSNFEHGLWEYGT